MIFVEGGGQHPTDGREPDNLENRLRIAQLLIEKESRLQSYNMVWLSLFLKETQLLEVNLPTPGATSNFSVKDSRFWAWRSSDSFSSTVWIPDDFATPSGSQGFPMCLKSRNPSIKHWTILVKMYTKPRKDFKEAKRRCTSHSLFYFLFKCTGMMDVIAAKWSRTECVHVLLANGADPYKESPSDLVVECYTHLSKN